MRPADGPHQGREAVHELSPGLPVAGRRGLHQAGDGVSAVCIRIHPYAFHGRHDQAPSATNEQAVASSSGLAATCLAARSALGSPAPVATASCSDVMTGPVASSLTATMAATIPVVPFAMRLLATP